MSSEKKIAANQANSKKSCGPKTALGKERSRRNATTHGLLSGELFIDELDKPEFEGLSSGLHDDLRPGTTLQKVCLGRILNSIWKIKLALRLAGRELEATSEEFHGAESPVQKDGSAQSLLPTKYYYADRPSCKAALALVSRVRGVVQGSGFLHAQELKPEMVRAFGEDYFAMLTQWAPMSPSAIKMANMLAEHAEKLGSPLPPAVEPANKPLIVDPQLGWQMAVKLLEQSEHHLQGLLRADGLGADSAGQERRMSAAERANRYYVTATRELEHAVSFYQYLKEQGL